MPFDHYIPAGYLGRFSNDTNPVRRNRRLWAVDKRENRLFQATAAELCGLHNFYTLSPKNEDPRFVDSVWAGYENRLNPALDQMIVGRLDAMEWLKTLVVFAAALLVRGGDFNSRFNDRFSALGPGLEDRLTSDNTNLVRLMELQRLFASMIGARWLLLKTSGKYTQITNDLGYTPFLKADRQESGIAIPVSHQHILLIIACRRRVIARGQNGKWVPEIERSTLTDEAHAAFRENIAACAQRYVIGPDEASMRRYLKAESTAPPIPEPQMLGFLNGAMARHYEMIYFHLVTYFSSPPQGRNAQAYVDYDKNMPKEANEPAAVEPQLPTEPGDSA
jgi:hypothetical protein